MATGRSSRPRAVRSRWPENEVTQTRSQAPVRRSTSGSSEIPGTSFRSMLKRTSGQAPSRSSISGIGSAPPMRRAVTSWKVRALIGPVRVGDPVQGAVMEGHELPVRGGASISLEVGVPELDRVLERDPGVLRVMGGAAPVGERDGLRMIEERCSHDR